MSPALNLDLVSLRIFVLVCEAGSLSRVAQQEALVVSAISKRIAQLEDRVGTRLLDRRMSGVAPTPSGLTLLEHARAMLAIMDDIERDIVARARLPQGQVRVFAAAAALAEQVPEDVAEFLTAVGHEGIRVSVEERLSHAVVEGVRSGAATLGICWDVVDSGALHAVPYRTDHLGLVVPDGHPLAGREAVRFSETLPYDHIGLPAASNFQTTLRDAARVSAEGLHYRAVVETFEAAARLARAGVGVAVVPREVAFKALPQEARQRGFVPLSDGWATRRFIICCRSRDQLSVAAGMLFDFMASRGDSL
ncbi:LysR family transcriptional regulator [Variovorax terrae]|uniref:LysR family transcriptional regulator n=1 Tax=Variovorax terrae TaxID=2923278 RepID=A0A9X1VWQ0_9BURK|nr:LysR family transcriptional regulator [Variovorax terrae]MCJ0764635.1 LysR family transcriptional regulator [Variovorax terrae]